MSRSAKENMQTSGFILNLYIILCIHLLITSFSRNNPATKIDSKIED